MHTTSNLRQPLIFVIIFGIDYSQPMWNGFILLEAPIKPYIALPIQMFDIPLVINLVIADF
uniref:Uncharacterized protein n=1 Tax=Moorena producens (strain JHB) TaxID=1454205 RepID=A0A1D9FZU8_MOOP1